ncbi:MAG: FixH family protein [Ignavibacteria bacterium]|nr:FixH family protein [Ignavibacteria bacterium]
MKKKIFKMTWGKGILLAYLSFVTGIVFMVYRSVAMKIDMVTDNYYEKTLIYQKEIEKMRNTMSLKEKIKLEVTDNKYLDVIYPIKPDGGVITFYRPSDSSADFNLNISADEKLVQRIDISGITRGLWKLKFNWSGSGGEYYQEEIVILQ